jgi:hypothetical protein
MALKHHWKFNNNLQDAIGDLHLTNVVGTPTYTSNKDGVANSCADFDTTWHGYSEALPPDSILENATEFTYSFWLYVPNISLPLQNIYVGRMSEGSGNFGIYISSNALVFPSNNGGQSFIITRDNNWHHYVIKYSTSGIKSFEDGVLKYSTTNTKYTRTQNKVIFGVGVNLTNYKLNTPLDEFKFFDHSLTDGGVTTIGQAASLDSEVWQLYLAGVNNIPAYTQNTATDITGTSARLTWNES